MVTQESNDAQQIFVATSISILSRGMTLDIIASGTRVEWDLHARRRNLYSLAM